MLARIGRWFLLAILLSGVVYLGDYLAVRFPGSRNPFGTVNVQPYYAIHQKSGRTEYDYSPPAEMQSCVASLFPHLDSPPCWYLSKHKTRVIDI